MNNLFKELELINARPKPFEFYTASDLWTDEYLSEQMLSFHLNDEVDLSSRNSKFIARSVDWICDYFQVGSGTSIADFGCGPGLYASRLAERQAKLTGIDFSSRSIAYARDFAQEHGLEIDYVNQNYLEYETSQRFDLIIMIFCDFCALSPAQRKKLLGIFNQVLNPGGSLLMDVHSKAAFGDFGEETRFESNLMDGFWSPDPYYGFVKTFKYEPESVRLDKYTIVEAQKISTIYNWLQYFSPDALQTEFEQSGFEVIELFGNVAGDPIRDDSPEIAMVARKA